MWIIHGMGEQKFIQTVQVTCPRWPPCPYMVKTLKNLLLWNQMPDDLESWYAASGTRLPNLFKWCPWVDVAYFTARSNLFPYAFVWENVNTMDFSETIIVCDIKVGRCSQLNECMKLYEYQRWRSCIDLGPNHSDSIFLNVFSSITTYFNISSALRWGIQDQWSSGSKAFTTINWNWLCNNIGN